MVAGVGDTQPSAEEEEAELTGGGGSHQTPGQAQSAVHSPAHQSSAAHSSWCSGSWRWQETGCRRLVGGLRLLLLGTSGLAAKKEKE